jgi:hypothetical protein
MSISNTTLQAYYPLVRPLRTHLADILVHDASTIKRSSEMNISNIISTNNLNAAQHDEELLTTCLVAVAAVPDVWPTFTPCAPMCTMRDVQPLPISSHSF